MGVMVVSVAAGLSFGFLLIRQRYARLAWRVSLAAEICSVVAFATCWHLALLMYDGTLCTSVSEHTSLFEHTLCTPADGVLEAGEGEADEETERSPLRTIERCHSDAAA